MRLGVRCSYCFGIWQAARQQCCRGACRKLRAIGKFLTLMSSLRDFAKSCDKTLPPFGTVHIWNYTHRGVILTGKQANFQCCTHLCCHCSVYQIVVFVWCIYCFRVWTLNRRIWCMSETGSTTRTLSHWSEKKAPPLAKWSTNRWVFIDVPLLFSCLNLIIFFFDTLYLKPFEAGWNITHGRHFSAFHPQVSSCSQFSAIHLKNRNP